MKKIIIAVGLMFAGVGALMLGVAPDTLSMLIIGAMLLIIAMGFVIGLAPTVSYDSGFRAGINSIDHIQEINASTEWIAVEQIDYFFQQKTLDKLFYDYKLKVHEQQRQGLVISDIEDVINEDALALRSWQTILIQIPGTMTGLGILGTFLGLITGISSVGFSSVEAALSSITVLLAGIRTAFYTSIVGVILSILFNMVYKFLWNSMVRSMGLFTEEFHMQIQPTVEEQMRDRQNQDMKKIIERLDRLPKDRGFSMAVSDTSLVTDTNEQQMMPEIKEGLQNGEFIFHLQPKYNLNSRKIVGAEALMRWNHGDMGILKPALFLPVVEQNGYITKLDKYIWEEVIKTIRKWIDLGLRPVPVSVNISKTDVLATDIVQFFTEMVHKYHIPPLYLELEISQNAYEKGANTAIEAETGLRQAGFRVIVDGFNGDFVALSKLGKSQADAMKLDLRFIDEKNSSAIINDVFDQARRLHMEIATVGIGNTEQMNALKKSGCTIGQGEYLSRPVTLEEFEQLIK